MHEKRAPMDPAFTLFIAGGSASGKSTLAGRVSDALARAGRHAVILRQDSFYRDRPDSVDGADRHAFDFDVPDAIDWAAMTEALRALRARQAAPVPLYDFTVSKRAGETTVTPGDVLLVDGTLVLHTDALAPLRDSAVYVRADEALRRERRTARDQAERGRSLASIDAQLSGQVFPAHNRYVAPSAVHADLVLDAPAVAADTPAAVQQVMALIAP